MPTDPFSEIGIAFLAVAPLIALLLALRWAARRKDRKKKLVELSYNLIALDVLIIMLLPIRAGPFDYGFWLLIPIAMFALLMGFLYHRKKREHQHKRRVAKALSDGHVELSELLEGRIEAEIKKKKGGKEKAEVKKEPEKEPKKEPKEILKVEPEPVKKEEHEHKKIERVVDRVVKKNKKKRAQSTT
jgi:hypothetical protein